MEIVGQADESPLTAHALEYAAQQLEASVADLQVEAINGGYSRNRRALVGNGHKWLFVKEVDVSLLPGDGAEELAWLAKDYGCAETLRSVVPDLVSDASSLSPDGHVLTLTAYREEDGWSWTLPEKSEEQTAYIQAVVDATKRLEDVRLPKDMNGKLQLQPVFRDEIGGDDGLERISSDNTFRSMLVDKYRQYISQAETDHKRSVLGNMLQLIQDDTKLRVLRKVAERLKVQPQDYLDHCDVRSDNIAYNPATGRTVFVDWNWASYTPRKFASTEFLVNIAGHDSDVSPWHDELNTELLAALVGFWLTRCVKQPLAPGNTLRDMQAKAAATAYDLYLSI